MEEYLDEIPKLQRELTDVIKGIQTLSSSIFSNSNALTNEKITSDVINLKSEQPFIFTGQITDLSYFQYSKTMPIEAIANIENDKLRQTVKETLETCSKENLITIDNDKGIIKITKKGENYIGQNSFVNEAKSHQKQALMSKITNLNSSNLSNASNLTAGVANKAIPVVGAVSEVGKAVMKK